MLSKFWHSYSIWIVGISTVVLVAISVYGFFALGGAPYKDLPQAQATINPTLSPECRQKQLDQLKAEAPIQAQIDAINQQESKLSQQFVSAIPDGQKRTLLEMVGDAYDSSSGKSYRQEVLGLQTQWLGLQGELDKIARKYVCA